MIFIKIVIFILGIYLSMRMIAALYGLIDFRYAIKTAYPKVLLRIAGCGAVIFLLGIFLGKFRQAFFWGMATYGLLFLISYVPTKLLLARDVRATDIK